MPRRSRPRWSRQKHKHKKRPRKWHRTSKKPLRELAREMGVGWRSGRRKRRRRRKASFFMPHGGALQMADSGTGPCKTGGG